MSKRTLKTIAELRAENNTLKRLIDSKNTGEWIHSVTGRSPFKCSICGKLAWYSSRDIAAEVRSNFCPNCGADMRKEMTETEKFAEKVYKHLMEHWSGLKSAMSINYECEWLRKEIFSCIESEKENESKT